MGGHGSFQRLVFDCAGANDVRTEFETQHFMRVLTRMEAKLNEADKHELNLLRQDAWRSLMRECDIEHGNCRPEARATFFAFHAEIGLLPQQLRRTFGPGHDRSFLVLRPCLLPRMLRAPLGSRQGSPEPRGAPKGTPGTPGNPRDLPRAPKDPPVSPQDALGRSAPGRFRAPQVSPKSALEQEI